MKRICCGDSLGGVLKGKSLNKREGPLMPVLQNILHSLMFRINQNIRRTSRQTIFFFIILVVLLLPAYGLKGHAQTNNYSRTENKDKTGHIIGKDWNVYNNLMDKGIFILTKKNPQYCLVVATLDIHKIKDIVGRTLDDNLKKTSLESINENPLEYLYEYADAAVKDVIPIGFQFFPNDNVCTISMSYFEFQKYNDNTPVIFNVTIFRSTFNRVNWSKVGQGDILSIAANFIVSPIFEQRLNRESQKFWKDD